jgi:hybrid cluster-associated redox disulfide protein
MKITRKTNMNELLMEKPELAGLLLSSGMGCMGCPMAHMETIEDGCMAHGMNSKEIDKFIERLNKEEGKKGKQKGVKKR